MTGVVRFATSLLLAVLAGCESPNRFAAGPLGTENFAEIELSAELVESERSSAPISDDYSAYCDDLSCDDGNPCNGIETCGPYGCDPGPPMAEGAVCDDDPYPFTVDICRGNTCTKARCGDRVITSERGEECDDGNGFPGDGCYDCTWECVEDSHCDNGLECDGVESCDVESHSCRAGIVLATGASCAGGRGRCEREVCLLDSCDADDACQDGSLCNGIESCGSEGCELGAILDCDDGDPCTFDRCGLDGCESELVDADGDGQASESLGTCGTDCDDTRSEVLVGGIERCDGRDNDCDGAVDEDAVPNWYVDCDLDGFAAIGAASRAQCNPPPGSLTGCPTSGGGWTWISPGVTSFVDCNDANVRVYPLQSVYQFAPIASVDESVDFDYDCNGVEEAIFDAEVGGCEEIGYACELRPGWLSDVPSCGESALMIAGCQPSSIYGEPVCVAVPDATLRAMRCR